MEKLTNNGFFICKFCGKEIARPLYKIRNPESVFCDNTCRARYAEVQSLERQSLDETELESERTFCDKIIKSCFCIVVNRMKVAGRVSFEEMEHEATIAIWKFGKRANNNITTKGSFYYSTIKHAMINYVKNVVFKQDSCVWELDEQEDLIYYTTPEHLYQMKEKVNYLANRKQRSGSDAYALLLKYSFENTTLDAMAKETGYTKREITIKMNNARKQLEKELNKY